VVARRRRAAVALLALLAWPAAPVSAQTLTVDTAGSTLKIRASGFSFLKGDPLARLKDGRSVRVELAALVMATPGKSPAAATRRIFALSYDLWEERFAATVSGTGSRSVSHLALAAAEAWCIQQLTVPVSELGSLRSQPFWIRLESRILNGKSDGREDEGLTLRGIIDTLSRRQAGEKTSHSAEAGPFRVQQ